MDVCEHDKDLFMKVKNKIDNENKQNEILKLNNKIKNVLRNKYLNSPFI